MPDHYRSCASILLLRSKGGAKWEVLLLKKPRKRDAWQLPQGGVEHGETIEQAALRELMEEAGIAASVLSVSERCYQYDFPASYRRFRPDSVCGQCIRFVIATVDAGVTVHVDGKEIEDHVWMAPEAIGSYIKRKAYLRVVRSVLEEAKKQLPSMH
jgi:putative (di)nucleoside polyphosphate hydrolase